MKNNTKILKQRRITTILIVIGMVSLLYLDLIFVQKDKELSVYECKQGQIELYQKFTNDWNNLIYLLELEKISLEQEGYDTTEVENDIKKINFQKMVDKERNNYYLNRCEELLE